MSIYTSQYKMSIYTSQYKMSIYTSQNKIAIYTSQYKMSIYTSQYKILLNIAIYGVYTTSNPLWGSMSSSSEDKLAGLLVALVDVLRCIRLLHLNLVDFTFASVDGSFLRSGVDLISTNSFGIWKKRIIKLPHRKHNYSYR